VPLSVTCSRCGEQLVLQFVRAGEQFTCRNCGAVDLVPDTAEVTDRASTLVPPQPALPYTSASAAAPFPSTHTTVDLTKHLGMRVFSIVAATANVLYLFFTMLGLVMETTEFDPASVIVLLLLVVIGVVNIAVLNGKWLNLRKMAMAADMVVFLGLGTLWLVMIDDARVKTGAMMLIIVGIVTTIALAVCHRESWLALRIERSRLEELQRVAQLKKQLEPEQNDSPQM
jgi:hypothetical protein